MAIKMHITLGADTFDAEGDFALDEGFAAALRAWINARGDDTGEQLEQLAETIERGTDDLASAVAATTPAAQP
jgi:hypothetical protein